MVKITITLTHSDGTKEVIDIPEGPVHDIGGKWPWQERPQPLPACFWMDRPAELGFLKFARVYFEDGLGYARVSTFGGMHGEHST